MFQKYPCPPTLEDYTNLTLVYGRQGLDFEPAHAKATAFLSRFDVFKNLELPTDVEFAPLVGKQVRVSPQHLDPRNPSVLACYPYTLVPVARVHSFIDRTPYTLVLSTESGHYKGFDVISDDARAAFYEHARDKTPMSVFAHVKGLFHAVVSAKTPDTLFSVYKNFDYQDHDSIIHVSRTTMYAALVDMHHKPNYSEDKNAT